MLKRHRYKHKLLIPISCFSIIAATVSVLASYSTPTTHAVGRTLSDISTMQEMEWSVCKSSAIGATATLRDVRDNNTYTVRRHEDGNCWMTQNLRLTTDSLASTGHSNVLTSLDTDMRASDNYTLPISSLNGFDGSSSYLNEMYYAEDETNGAYYSFIAATAGTGDASLISGDAPSSICPKGWKLPSYSGDSSYANLLTAAGIQNDLAGSRKITAAPYSFAYAGYASNGDLILPGREGDYWTRTALSENVAGNLGFYLGEVRVVGYGRPTGITVRCVATGTDPTASSTLSVIVDNTITIDAVSNMEQLVDSRIINKGSISAIVSANVAYQVLLHAIDTELRNPKLVTEDAITIPTASSLVVGTNAWGVESNDSTMPYQAMATTPRAYHNTTKLGDTPSQTIHTFGIGVTVSPLLPSGTYSTDVTVTVVGV